MPQKRIILEFGTGNDLYGMDYTKAAVRAVQDALHHSSLVLFLSLDIDPESMQIEVNIGVQQPDEIDQETVARQLPYGSVTVKPQFGGMNIVDKENDITTVIANAAITVRLDLADQPFSL